MEDNVERSRSPRREGGRGRGRGRRGGRGQGRGRGGGKPRGSDEREGGEGGEKSRGRRPSRRGRGGGKPRDTEEREEGDHSQSHRRQARRGRGGGKANADAEGGSKKKGGRRRKVSFDEKSFYEEWWTKEQIDEGMANGSVFIGALRINSHNRREAYVTSDSFKYDIFIDGEKSRNRALNGDLVAVKMNPQDTWKNRKIGKTVDGIVEAIQRVRLEDDDAGLWNPIVPQGSSAAADPSEKSKGHQDEHQSGVKVPLDTGDLQPSGQVVAVVVANEEAGISIAREHLHKHIGVIVPQYGFNRTAPKPIVPGHHLPAVDRVVEFHPLDNKIPFMLIPREDAPQDFLEDPTKFAPPHAKLFEAVMVKWEPAHRFPLGKIVRQVGEAGEIGPETEALLIENNCDHGEFPQEALDVLREKIPDSGEWSIPEEEFSKRLDLRESRRIFTIDPATAKDLDDALHCLPVQANTVKGVNGAFLPAHYEIGVHIADVSFFVEPDTALDKEAQRRSTTVYLVNKVLPMLPPILSEEFCSLNEGVDRCAFSCIWRMSEDGELLSNAPPPWFGRTLIRSCARLDYGLAQRMVDGQVTAESVDTGNDEDEACWPDKRAPAPPHTKQEVIDDVCLLVKIAMKRRKKRFSRHQGGALAMKQTKMYFRLDDKGNPTFVQGYPIRDTNKTIEEYMLMANYLVAQQLILGIDKKAFIRHHPPPDPASMASLIQLLEKYNLDVDPTSVGSAAGLHSTLEHLERTQSALFMEVVYALLRKPMKQAKYAPAGSLEQPEWRHWALNIPYYTHFTSPIRRYADIMVHRQLHEILCGTTQDYTVSLEDLERISEHCNEKKEASKKAQDQSDKLFLAVLVKQRFDAGQPIETKAIVHDLGPQSFTMLLVDYGLECRVHVTNDFKGTNLKVVFDENAIPESARAPQQQEDQRNRNRRRRGRGGKGKGKAGDDENDGQQNGRQQKKKEEVKPVLSLTMDVVPFLQEGAKAETIVIELLSCMDVILEPTISHNSRIDVNPRFLRMHARLLQDQPLPSENSL